jgi:hypothetical protein
MRLHSDVLTQRDLFDAAMISGLHSRGAYVESVTLHRSRSRARGMEFRLASDRSNQYRNSGQYGAEVWGPKAASWDDHGVWMAELFDRDPNAIIGPYKGRDAFHCATKEAYIKDAVGQG